MIQDGLRSWEGRGPSPARSSLRCRDMAVTHADWVPTPITSGRASGPQIWERTPCLVTRVQSRQWTQRRRPDTSVCLSGPHLLPLKP